MRNPSLLRSEKKGKHRIVELKPPEAENGKHPREKAGWISQGFGLKTTIPPRKKFFFQSGVLQGTGRRSCTIPSPADHTWSARIYGGRGANGLGRIKIDLM